MEIKKLNKNLFFIYLNGDRGLEVLKSLILKDYKNLEVFIDKKNTTIEDFCSKNDLVLNSNIKVNSDKHIVYVMRKNPYLSIVAGFSQIFNNKLIDLPQKGTVNLHAGPLPEYRGGSPLNWQIIEGKSKIGISLIKMNEGIDTGEVIEIKYFSLSKSQNIGDAHSIANKFFPSLVLNFLGKLNKNSVKLIKQKTRNAKYWHQRQDRDGLIRWDKMNASQVHNFVRALTNPYKGAFSYYRGKKVRILKTDIIKEGFYGTPGRIIKNKKSFIVICSDKGIKIENYIIEGYKGTLLNGKYLTNG